MRKTSLYATGAALAAAAALAASPATTAPLAAQSSTIRARAEIRGEGITGTADFREVAAESAGATDPRYTVGTIAVEISVKVTGLAPGAHGVHLHEIGKCEPDFSAAGGHFDPGPHGMTDPDANHPFHMGDLPNLIVGAEGVGSFIVRTTRVTLSAGPTSVFDENGTAIIIHGNPDQGVTGEPKSGVSGGPRVACGVVTRIN